MSLATFVCPGCGRVERVTGAARLVVHRCRDKRGRPMERELHKIEEEA